MARYQIDLDAALDKELAALVAEQAAARPLLTGTALAAEILTDHLGQSARARAAADDEVVLIRLRTASAATKGQVRALLNLPAEG